MRLNISTIAATAICLTTTVAFGQGTITFTDIAGVAGSTSFTTADTAVTINSSGPFAAGGDFWGINGGGNNGAIDTTESIDFVFNPSVGLSDLSFRWTRAQVTLSGFTANPGASVVTNPGGNIVATYDANSNSVVINHPWQAGTASAISFSNPNASAGKTITLTTFDPAPAWQATLIDVGYDLGNIPLLPGDVDGNGAVDLTDFGVIRDHFFFNSVTRDEGDLTSDGLVDFDDFDEWKVNFDGDASAALAQLVPEPASAMLLALGLLAPCGAISRRRESRA